MCVYVDSCSIGFPELGWDMLEVLFPIGPIKLEIHTTNYNIIVINQDIIFGNSSVLPPNVHIESRW